MSSAALRALFCSLALVCGACAMMGEPSPPHASAAPATPAPAAASLPAATPAAASAVTATPSPRPDCTRQSVTLYFTDVVQSEQPVATPLLDLMMDHVHACLHAGGAIRSAVIATTADAGQSDSDAAAQLERRRERVRDTLVHVGIPADKIQYAPTGQPDPDAIMAKHADITVDLY
jgi:hypothetical protein